MFAPCKKYDVRRSLLYDALAGMATRLLLLFRSVHSAHVCPRRERMQVTETTLHGSVPVH